MSIGIGEDMKKVLVPQDWGLNIGSNGELQIEGFGTTDLAEKYGTPLHVINEPRLSFTANQFLTSMTNSYKGKVSVYYAFKCNSVPYVVSLIENSGLGAEITTDYELELAVLSGFSGNKIIVNGPNKTSEFIKKCLEYHVRFIVVDSLEELLFLDKITSRLNRKIEILLRVNPNYIPKGMNKGSATGSRKGSLFGLDLESGEIQIALEYLTTSRNLIFKGLHFHIGTGIRYPKDYSNALTTLSKLFEFIRSTQFNVEVLDVGGGISSSTSRELTSRELLLYQGFNYLPLNTNHLREAKFEEFGKKIAHTVYKYFAKDELPELIFEPGRSIVSQNQFLLIKVHQVKQRKKANTWLITDGGLGTVSMPTYYEYHEVFLCNDVFRPKIKKVSINGSCCFSADIIYKNILMPKVNPGEVLAVMDSGAYFTALESQFGFQRPAIISASKNQHRIIRKRESIEEMMLRDDFKKDNALKEVI